MAKVWINPERTKQQGFVMTERDLPDWQKKKGRPRKVKNICIRRRNGQAFTYAVDLRLRRISTQGMKKSQGLMQEAALAAKSVWKDQERRKLWEARYAQKPGKYKSAWMLLVGICTEWLQEMKRQGRHIDASLLEDRRKTPNVPIKITQKAFRSIRKETETKRQTARSLAAWCEGACAHHP